VSEFLVRIEIDIPPELDDSAREEMVAAEARRGRELIVEGCIQRIWRIPGRTANVGIWRASDATQLHAQLATLPMFPYIEAEVLALATHPLERTD
jgi:muconolactone D-isomerase